MAFKHFVQNWNSFCHFWRSSRFPVKKSTGGSKQQNILLRKRIPFYRCLHLCNFVSNRWFALFNRTYMKSLHWRPWCEHLRSLSFFLRLLTLMVPSMFWSQVFVPLWTKSHALHFSTRLIRKATFCSTTGQTFQTCKCSFSRWCCPVLSFQKFHHPPTPP